MDKCKWVQASLPEGWLSLTWSGPNQPQSQTSTRALAWHSDKYNETGQLYCDCYMPFETEIGLCYFEFVQNRCCSHQCEEISLAVLLLGISFLVLKKKRSVRSRKRYIKRNLHTINARKLIALSDSDSRSIPLYGFQVISVWILVLRASHRNHHVIFDLHSSFW